MTPQCISPVRLDVGRRCFLANALAVASTSLLDDIAFGADKKPLTLAFIPQENPEKLIGDIKTISSFLEQQMGVPVRGFVTSDHASAVEALRNADADISFMGALPFVIAEKEVGAEVLLSEVYRGSASYRGRVFVRRDSGVERLADLRGKSIAFADPISESGYLYPLDTFIEAGLFKHGQDPKSFFSELYFAGGYQQAMQAMATGLVDAAGASQYAELLLSPEQQAGVKWVAESDLIPSHVVIARSGIDAELKTSFTNAMMKLNEPDNRYLLKHVYSPDGYVVADPSAFEGVRQLASKFGLLE